MNSKFFCILASLLAVILACPTGQQLVGGQCIDQQCLEQFSQITAQQSLNEVTTDPQLTISLTINVQSLSIIPACLSSSSLYVGNNNVVNTMTDMTGQIGEIFQSQFTQDQLNSLCTPTNDGTWLKWNCGWTLSFFTNGQLQFQYSSSFWVSWNSQISNSLAFGVQPIYTPVDPTNTVATIGSEAFLSDESCNQVSQVQYDLYQLFWVCQQIDSPSYSLQLSTLNAVWGDGTNIQLKSINQNFGVNAGRSWIAVQTYSPYTENTFNPSNPTVSPQPVLGNLTIVSVASLNQAPSKNLRQYKSQNKAAIFALPLNLTLNIYHPTKKTQTFNEPNLLSKILKFIETYLN